MSKHTPEPWQFDDNPDICTNFYSDDATGSIIGSCQEYKFAHRSIDERKANANRIVYCVNACAGMDNPTEEIAELKSQRDELLEAAKAVVTRWNTPNCKDTESTAAVIGRLMAIISKCSGSAS